MEKQKPFIEMQKITKRFPGVLALDHVNFDVRKGEIHALLGENGAGKTTLMNILYGLYKPDEGEIYLEGKKADIRSPKDAINLGIGMVHQHLSLVPTFTVAENIALGLKSDKEPLLDLKKIENRITELSKGFNLEVDPRAKVMDLPIGVQQRVEILKAIYRGAKVLILDEPTTVLTPPETEVLFKNLKLMVKKGLTVVFITHKLYEVLKVSDRITVLRRGRVVGTTKPKESREKELIKMMVGKELIRVHPVRKTKTGKVILEVKDLHALDDRGAKMLSGCTFQLHEGEILGVAGVAGNGQSELVEVIMGLRKATNGRVIINGKDMTNKPVWEVLRAGVSYIPEDRVKNTARGMSVAENLVMYNFRSFINKYNMLDYNSIKKHARNLIDKFNIVTPNETTPAGALSGGNIQRTILARALSIDFKMLISCHPTVGLDVASTAFIHNMLIKKRDEGAAILLISEDLDEIMELSDRIAVMYKGKIVDILPRGKADKNKIGFMMMGAIPNSKKVTKRV
jgi:simple sugar transport system ATP-binding protein